jgi:hypothetical protein
MQMHVLRRLKYCDLQLFYPVYETDQASVGYRRVEGDEQLQHSNSNNIYCTSSTGNTVSCNW